MLLLLLLLVVACACLRVQVVSGNDKKELYKQCGQLGGCSCFEPESLNESLQQSGFPVYFDRVNPKLGFKCVLDS